MNKHIGVGGVLGVLITLFSLFLVSELAAVDNERTWAVTYNYNFAPGTATTPAEMPEGFEIFIPISVSVSANITATGPGGGIQTLDVPFVDSSGFSHTFIMDETGVYSIKEKYILTIEDSSGLIRVKQKFTRIVTWNYNNSSLGGGLFELKDMYITNYEGELVSDVLLFVPPITPEPCRPDDPADIDDPDGVVNMKIRTARIIEAGEDLLSSVSLSTDWYKLSSLNPIPDDEPPVIDHDLLTYTQAGSPVYANVTDNIQVASVIMHLKDAANNDYPIEMTLMDGGILYKGYIPYRTRVGFGEYYIWAVDLGGNEAVYPSPAHAIYVTGVYYGDINEDSEINDADADLALQKAIGQIEFTEKKEALGDVSGDVTISSYDSALILQHWQEIIDTFPVEGAGLPSGSVNVTIQSYTEQPGSNITVPVMIGNTSGLEIIGIDITFTYDPDILTLTGITRTGALTSQWDVLTDDTTAGQINLAMAHYNELSGAGSIVKFSFHVSEASTHGQTSPLALTNISLDEGNITANVTNGLLNVIETIDVEIPLGAGWNIFSICVDPEDDSLASVLGTIEAQVKSVWAYSANPGWERHVYGGPAENNNLENIVPGKGYFIEMESATTLTVTGLPLSSTSIVLYAGWNLAGYNSLESLPPGSANLPAGASVHEYDNGTDTWKRYFSGSPTFLNEIDLLETGKGYWIHAAATGLWTVPSP